MKNSRKSLLCAALGAAIGTSLAPAAMAAQHAFYWQGQFAAVDPTGNLLFNTSSPNGSKGNNFTTPITGTLVWDTETGTGTATIDEFDFLNSTLPAAPRAVTLTAIGDGTAGGSGSLILGNMLVDWEGNTGIPVSVVWDGQGFLDNLSDVVAGGFGSTLSGVGAVPAIDGSYLNFRFGYVNIGPSPLATTNFNTTNVPGCSYASCNSVNPSGTLPLILDTAENQSIGYYTPGNTLGIAGSPIQDGPFLDFNLAFEITSLTYAAEIVPPLEVSLNVAGGVVHECTSPSGDGVNMSVTIGGVGSADSVSSVIWTEGATVIGTGVAVSPVLALGTHNITVTVETVNGRTKTDSVSVTVRDSTSPVIDAKFTDRSGAEVSTVSGNRVKDISPVYSVSDACDPEPTVEASLGLPLDASGGADIEVYRNRLSISSDRSVVELSVRAQDANGRSSVKNVELLVE